MGIISNKLNPNHMLTMGGNALLKAWNDHPKNVINVHQQLMPITYTNGNFGGCIMKQINWHTYIGYSIYNACTSKD
jgi:hypothetical protein